jgi:hypothetical protein
MKNQLVKQLESQIKHNNQKIEKGFNDLKANFCHQLAWKCEDMFMLSFKNENYQELIHAIEVLKEEEGLNTMIERFEQFLSHSFHVRENSTGVMHREASTWKFICTMELLKEFRNFKKSINQ